MSARPELLHRLAEIIGEIVDARVEAKLAALGIAATEYTSRRPPPGVTSRTFSRWCRCGRVTGARRDGNGWACTAEQWRKARAGEVANLPQRDLGKSRDQAAANDVDALLMNAGLRPTARRAP